MNGSRHHVWRKAVVLALIPGVFLIGQTDLDAVRPFTGLGGPGGRANGLGQAFTGIADDITALYYNPAGLGHLTKAELNLGFSHFSITTDVTSPGSANSSTITTTRLNNAGFALPVADTKLTVAAGYDKVRTFERERERTNLINEPPVNDWAQSAEHLTEQGYLGIWSFGLGYQISTKAAVGAAVELLSGTNTYTERSTFTTASQAQDSIDYFVIEPRYTGLGLSVGILLSPLPSWRVGLLIRSPQSIKVEEEFSDNSGEISPIYEYKTRSSYSMRLGSSLNLGPLLLSGDLFWFDYSQIRFESDLYLDNLLIDVDINETLRGQYNSALGYAAGAEFLLPMVNAKVRAGYRHDPPIIRDAPGKAAPHTFSVGASVVPVPQIKIDAALTLTSWERNLSVSEREDNTAGELSVNFIYRF